MRRYWSYVNRPLMAVAVVLSIGVGVYFGVTSYLDRTASSYSLTDSSVRATDLAVIESASESACDRYMDQVYPDRVHLPVSVKQRFLDGFVEGWNEQGLNPLLNDAAKRGCARAALR